MELRYRAEIDGLRAIAVLLVIACHAGWGWLPGGFIGVDVFFVISGYLITGLLHAEWEGKGTVSLMAFFARRVRRLLPALAAVTVATLAAGAFTLFPQELPRLGKSATALSFLVANVHFLGYSGGYFDPSTDVMPLLHTWSLSVEEQYYLVWPVVVIVCGLAVRRLGAPQTLPGIVLFVIALISLGAFVEASSTQSRNSAFYLVQYRAWEFAIGGLAMLISQSHAPTGGQGQLLAIAGLALIGATAVLLNDAIPFPGIAAVAPVIGAALVLYGLARGTSGAAKQLLCSPVMVRVGLISYSLYLWHWPLLALTRAYYLGQRDPVRDTIAVAAAFVLAGATYRWIEVPIRYRKPGWFARSGTTLIAGLAMSAIVIILAQAIIHYGKRANANLNRHLVEAGADEAFFASCHANGGRLAPPGACVAGDSTAAPDVVVWGDSHAGQLKEVLSSRRGASLFRIQPSCPPVIGAAPVIKGLLQTDCVNFNDNVSRELLELPEVKGIVLAARWNTYLALPVVDPGGITSYGMALLPPPAEDLPITPTRAAEAMSLGLRNALRGLPSRLRILVVAPVPEMYFHVPQCLYLRSEQECVVARSRVEMRREPAMRILMAVAKEFPNVRIVDPINEFCDAERCNATYGGIASFSDDNHISLPMARHLSRRWTSELTWLTGSSVPLGLAPAAPR